MQGIQKALSNLWPSGNGLFCRECGLPVSGAEAEACSHGSAALWSELDDAERRQVRSQAIQAAKAGRRSLTPVMAG